jgi:hypothetical protein
MGGFEICFSFWPFPELKLDQRDGRYAAESGSQQANGYSADL